MSNKTFNSILLSGLPDTYRVPPQADEFDSTQAYSVGDHVTYNGKLYEFTSAHEAGAWITSNVREVQVADEIADLKSAFKLLMDDIPGTVQSYVFSNGAVSQVVHSSGQDVVRTDDFTYDLSTITETRVLNNGHSIEIITNLTTLETTVTYTPVA